MSAWRVLAGWILLGASVAWAEEPADPQQTPPAEQPVQTEVIHVQAPTTMLAPEAQELMRRLRAQARRSSGKPARPATRPADPPATGRPTRVIEIEPAPVVNRTSRFRFEDVTGRQPAQPRLTLEQRRALAERYRQSLTPEPAPEPER